MTLAEFAVVMEAEIERAEMQAKAVSGRRGGEIDDAFRAEARAWFAEEAGSAG